VPDSSEGIAEISDCDQDDRSALSSLYSDKRGGSVVKRFERRLR
jgi:hypothetical protein